MVQESPKQVLEYNDCTVLRYTLPTLILMQSPQVVHLLQPGELYIVDNLRVLHGRKKFKLNGGVRHMMVRHSLVIILLNVVVCQLQNNIVVAVPDIVVPIYECHATCIILLVYYDD